MPARKLSELTASDAAMARLVEAIGNEAAQKLARRYGGITLYVPKAPGANHPIRVALGEVATARLVEWCGGGRINVPKQAVRPLVLQLRRAGALTVAAIALEAGISERHVYRLCAADSDDRQLDLFQDF